MISDPRQIDLATVVVEHTVTTVAGLNLLIAANPERIGLLLSTQGFSSLGVSTSPTEALNSGLNLTSNNPTLGVYMTQSAGACCKAWYCFDSAGNSKLHVTEIFYRPWMIQALNEGLANDSGRTDAG